MWKWTVIVIGAFIVSLAIPAPGQCFTENDDDGQEVATDASKRLVTGSTEFALKLFAMASKGKMAPNDNLVLSPISVWSALTAVYHGARGRTKQEMEEVLKYGDTSQKRVNQLYHNLTNSLQHKVSARANYTLKLVNRVYTDVNLTLRDCILEYLASELEKLPLSSYPEGSRKIINRWVEMQTNDKIVELLPNGYITADTVMVLVNAVYFKALWAKRFDSFLTMSVDFFVEPNRPVKVDTMILLRQQLRIARGDGYAAIELPFHGEDVRMIIVLSKVSVHIDDLISNLTGHFLKRIYNSLKLETVILWMPKFKAENSLELVSHLTELGIRDLFLPGVANLTGFSEAKTFVKFVRHKAYIDVTESGVEAAAAAAVVTADRSGSFPKQFRIDRPFVFVIHHRKMDVILSLGIIRNPKSTHTPHRG